MDWIALSLLCAFSLASADAATKAWLGDFSTRELTLVRFTLTGLLLSPLLLGMPSLGDLPPAFWGWIAVLLPLEITAMALYLAAIRDHPLSLTLPYLAFTPVFVTLVAFVAAGRAGDAGRRRRGDAGGRRGLAAQCPPRPPGRLAQLGLAAAGHPLRARLANDAGGGGDLRRDLDPGQGGHAAPAVALLRGLLLRPAGPGDPDPVRPAATRPSASRTGSAPGGRPWAVLAVVGLNALMIYTHFLALQLVQVAYMISVKRVSLLFGILYGALLFHEPGLRTQLPAGVLMLAGVFLIALA